MPFDIRVEAHVAEPPENVAAYMFDPMHDREWISGIEDVDPPAAPIGVATETHRVARFMGRRIDYVLRVTEHVPDRRLVMASVRAPFPMGVTYGVESDRSGSRVSIRVTGGYGLLMRLAQPVLSRQIKRSLQADLRHLRGRLVGTYQATRQAAGEQR